MENKLNLILYYLLVGIMLFTLLFAPIVMVTYSRLYPEEFHFSEIPYVLLGVLYQTRRHLWFICKSLSNQH